MLKIKRILLILVIILVSFQSTVFANSSSLDLFIEDLNSSGKSWFLYESVSWGELQLTLVYSSISNPYELRRGSGDFIVFKYEGDSYTVSSKRFDLRGNFKSNGSTPAPFTSNHVWSSDLTKDTTRLLRASSDIYFEGTNDVFFSVIPTLLEVVEMEMEMFLPVLVGKIQKILPVGFGVLSAMLLIVLLAVYFRRYLLRSI